MLESSRRTDLKIGIAYQSLSMLKNNKFSFRWHVTRSANFIRTNGVMFHFFPFLFFRNFNCEFIYLREISIDPEADALRHKVARNVGPGRREDRYNGPPAWQCSPVPLLRYTLHMLLRGPPPLWTLLFLSVLSSNSLRVAHLLRTRGQLFISNSRTQTSRGTEPTSRVGVKIFANR